MFSLPHLICTIETVYSTYLDSHDYISAPQNEPLIEHISNVVY